MILTDLPPEILQKILLHLPLSSLLLSALPTCKLLAELYKQSSELQYLVELQVAGCVNVPQTTGALVVVKDRLKKLRERESRWKSLEWSSRRALEVPHGSGSLYDYIGGVLALAVDSPPRTFEFWTLPCADRPNRQLAPKEYATPGGWVVKDFSLDPSQNLLALVEKWAPRHNNRRLGIGEFTYRIHLLNLDDFEPHKEAKEPIIVWPFRLADTNHGGRTGNVYIQIMNSSIYLHAVPSHAHHQQITTSYPMFSGGVAVWNWRTGNLVSVLPTTQFIADLKPISLDDSDEARELGEGEEDDRLFEYEEDPPSIDSVALVGPGLMIAFGTTVSTSTTGPPGGLSPVTTNEIYTPTLALYWWDDEADGVKGWSYETLEDKEKSPSSKPQPVKLISVWKFPKANSKPWPVSIRLDPAPAPYQPAPRSFFDDAEPTQLLEEGHYETGFTHDSEGRLIVIDLNFMVPHPAHPGHVMPTRQTFFLLKSFLVRAMRHFRPPPTTDNPKSTVTAATVGPSQKSGEAAEYQGLDQEERNYLNSLSDDAGEYVEDEDDEEEHHVIIYPWIDWSRQTRLVPSIPLSTAWVLYIFGYNFIHPLSNEERTEMFGRILDFNPLHIRKYRPDPEEAGTLMDMPSLVKGGAIWCEDVKTELPFIQRELPTFLTAASGLTPCGGMIDQERVIWVNRDDDDNLMLDVHIF